MNEQKIINKVNADVHKFENIKDPRNKFANTSKINKGFYNIRCMLKKSSDDENPNLFSYDKIFNEFELGKLLSKIIEQLPNRIEELGNVRAMIKYKFLTKTRAFFLGQ